MDWVFGLGFMGGKSYAVFQNSFDRQSFLDKGILKLEPVFGNYLAGMPTYSDPSVTDPQKPTDVHGLPEFVVRCTQKI